MPSSSLLLHAHPALGFWTVLWGAGLVVALVLRHRLDGRAVALWALGCLALVGLVPPRGGPVTGIARTCDLGAAHLLWPSDWLRQDPRMGSVALLLLVGHAVASRPRWVASAAAAPVVVEAVQYAVPSLARACSLPDVVPAWTALAVGVVAGLLVRTVDRGLRGTAVRPVAVLTVGAVAVTALAAWTGRPGAVTEAAARVTLLGEDFLPTGPVAGSAAPGAAWPDASSAPGAGTAYEDMSAAALRDLLLLTTDPDGEVVLPVAGPAGSWGYFWPRDGAFVAVALMRTGHAERADAILEKVGELYLDPMYGFDARYHLAGDRVTVDPRRAQVDGCGWVLWALHESTRSGAAAAPTPAATPVSSWAEDLRDRCTDQLLRATGGGSHLPAAGQDYWEQTTYDHLLGASAPVAAGLRLAAADHAALGRHDRSAQVLEAATGVRAQIERVFAPDYLRAGTHGGLDAAAAMLMPPFDPVPLPGVREAWLAYQREAARPGGGLAPGSGWKQDGISWTPEVALVAYTAAVAGEVDVAHHWLAWLDGHRAPWGSLPEKVDARGEPGGPAPLAWTSALVLLTLHALADAPGTAYPGGDDPPPDDDGEAP